MSRLIGFLKSRTKVTWALLVVYVISVPLAAFVQNPWLAAGSIFFSGILPIALFILWLSSLTSLKELGELLYIRASLWLALFVYGVLSHKWASDVINDIFHVAPSLFGGSTAVLAVLYGPIGVLYKPAITIVQIAWLILFLLIPVLGLYLLHPNARINLTKGKVAAAVVVFLFTIFIVPVNGLTIKNFSRIAEWFARWAEFNEKHRCVNPEVVQAHSVLFLSDTNVLAYFPSRIDGTRYQVLPCQYPPISNPAVQGTLRDKAAQRP